MGGLIPLTGIPVLAFGCEPIYTIRPARDPIASGSGAHDPPTGRRARRRPSVWPIYFSTFAVAMRGCAIRAPWTRLKALK
jgi:hypothetical protein